MKFQESNVQTTESSASAARRLFERGRNRLIAAGVTTAIGVAAIAGCAPTNAEASSPEDTSTPSATSAPVETAAPTPEVTVSPESLRLAADLPPQQLAEGAINLRTEWLLAGANAKDAKAVADGWNNHTSGGLDEYVDGIAQKNADFYTSALLADNWESDGEMVSFRNSSIDSNNQFIRSALKRGITGEPLMDISNTIVDAEEASAPDGQRIVNFKLHQEVSNTTDNPTRDEVVSYRFDTTDGTARLVGYVVSPGQ